MVKFPCSNSSHFQKASDSTDLITDHEHQNQNCDFAFLRTVSQAQTYDKMNTEKRISLAFTFQNEFGENPSS